MRKEYVSKSVEDTLKFAEDLAKSVSLPSIILLKGDLGAGKTHFVKGFVKGVGSKMLVSSPTFTIMNIYNDGVYPVYHFDMYRLSSADEAVEAGLEEYFELKTLDGVSIVEWPEKVEGLIRGNVIEVVISKLEKENERQISLEEKKC